MAIEVAGKRYVTLSDEFFVNGLKVYEAYANGVKVYPEESDLDTRPFKKPIGFGSGNEYAVYANAVTYYRTSTTCRIASCMARIPDPNPYDFYQFAIVAASDQPFVATRFNRDGVVIDTWESQSFEHEGKTVYFTGLYGTTGSDELYPAVYSDAELPFYTPPHSGETAWTIVYGRTVPVEGE